MQVTNVKDHVTHAVIGANEAHSFGIADTAAFFRVLSSSLYSNKPLAVVREILCNAWDAHIEGNVDRPVEVTLDRQKLVIRDFGTGLSPEAIIKNYTTYGGTTKIDNEEVTGGFGLGSKAPFAYVDHFEVTSWHDGTKTIWNMSLSSALVEGKPQVMKIVDLPCGDETGVQVSLKLKDQQDYGTFHRLLGLIARFGEMNLTLNGDKIETLPFSQAEHGFLIIDKATMPMASDARIWIRYGHVVYPLEHHDDFRGEYDRAKQFLKDINGSGYYSSGTPWVLILQAAPNMVSITPSRESLSMTDFTIENCRQLLNNFGDIIQNGMNDECAEIIEKAIQAVWHKRSKMGEMTRQQRTHPGQLLEIRKRLPNAYYFQQMKGPSIIRTMKDAAQNYLKCNNYPSSAQFFERDMDMRLDMLVKTHTLDKSWVVSFRAAVAKHRRQGGGFMSKDPWVYRKVLAPLVQILDNEKSMKSSNLLVFCHDKWNNELKPRPWKEMQAVIKTLADQLPFLRKIMILSHNRIDIIDRAHLFPVLREYLGSPKDSFCYIVPRHQGRVEEARQLFKKLGFTIIDLTVRQKWEPEKVAIKLEKKDAPPKRKGLSLLSNLLIHDRSKLSIAAGFELTAKTDEAPEYVIQVSPTRQDVPDNITGPFNDRRGEVKLAFVRLFGDRIGMAANHNQLQRYIDKGSKRPGKELIAEVLKEFQTNPKIEQHYRNYRAEKDDMNYDQDAILATIRLDPILRAEHKLPDPLPQRELDFVRLFESFYDFEYRNDKTLQAIADLVKSWTASPELKKVIDLISKDNHLISLVDTADIKRFILSGDAKKAAKTREFLAFVMKG